MKKLLFLLLCLVPALSVASGDVAASIDEIKVKLENSTVKPVDWYTKGDTEFAETNNRYIMSKIAINKNKAIANVKVARNDFLWNGVAICRTLTDIIPHEPSELSWDETKWSEDDKLISSVVAENLEWGKAKTFTLNDWKVDFTQQSELEVDCVIKKL
ncbi:hypothetical protein [Vibrio sp.]|uniref:hypothetical protein n=1 Tax=Vibrio sp. TaxID=678 RepID=UPI003AA7DF8C